MNQMALAHLLLLLSFQPTLYLLSAHIWYKGMNVRSLYN